MFSPAQFTPMGGGVRMAQPIVQVAPMRTYYAPFAPTPIVAPVAPAPVRVTTPEPVFVTETPSNQTLLLGALAVVAVIGIALVAGSK